jgi:hypothetical protein
LTPSATILDCNYGFNGAQKSTTFPPSHHPVTLPDNRHCGVG